MVQNLEEIFIFQIIVMKIQILMPIILEIVINLHIHISQMNQRFIWLKKKSFK